MNARSPMLMPTQLDLFASIISSAGSPSGPMPSDKLDGLTIDPFLQAPHLAKDFQPPDSSADLMINATSGRTCSASSASCALARSLESKLARNSPSNGGILWQAIWSRRITPQQRSISQRRAVVRPTIDRDYSGWQTPIQHNAKANASLGAMNRNSPELSAQVSLTHWGTPNT